MMTEKSNFTRLTIEQPDFKVSWEVPYEDVSIDEMIDGFNTLMIGITFLPETVKKGMAEWLMDHAYDLYDIYEHEDDKENQDD